MKNIINRIQSVPFLCPGLLVLSALLARAEEAAFSNTANLIASEIAAESGKPAANYREYAARLTQTIAAMSPEARGRVLKEHASRVESGTSYPAGGVVSPGGDGGPSTGGDPPPTEGPNHGGSAEPPPPPHDPPDSDPATEDPGAGEDPAMDDPSGGLTQTEQDLMAMFNEDPPPGESDVRDAIIDASPVSSLILGEAISFLQSSDLFQVFEANVPLPGDIYTRVLNGSAGLSPSDRLKIIEAQQAASANTP